MQTERSTHTECTTQNVLHTEYTQEEKLLLPLLELLAATGRCVCLRFAVREQFYTPNRPAAAAE